jgi:hypothetical protein
MSPNKKYYLNHKPAAINATADIIKNMYPTSFAKKLSLFLIIGVISIANIRQITNIAIINLDCYPTSSTKFYPNIFPASAFCF